MDEMLLLLERFANAQADTIAAPPLAVLEARARRRSVSRSLTSLSVVVLIVIGLVIGLASVGLASETGRHVDRATALSTADR